MGRGKVEIRTIDDDASRQAAFAKRRDELVNKARELALLCDADVGILLFPRGVQPFHYCSPHTSWTELIKRYESTTNAQLQGKDHEDDQVLTEMAALRRERDRLEASLRRQTGEDLPSGATRADLANLEKHLESTLEKIREMKDKLLNQELGESHRRASILEDQNSFLRHVMNEQHRAASERTAAAATESEGMATPMLPFGGFFPEVEEGLSTSLQLWPQQLPDVQGFGLQPSMRLW